MNDANLATICKKGPTDRPENYRPIALLNITYKILAIIIHVRLCESLDDKINLCSSIDAYRRFKRSLAPVFTPCCSIGKKLLTKSIRPE